MAGRGRSGARKLENCRIDVMEIGASVWNNGDWMETDDDDGNWKVKVSFYDMGNRLLFHLFTRRIFFVTNARFLSSSITYRWFWGISLTHCFTDLIKLENHKNSPNSGINSLHPFYEYPCIGIIFNNLFILFSQFTFWPLVRWVHIPWRWKEFGTNHVIGFSN